jgi:site-specific DNA recombinase
MKAAIYCRVSTDNQEREGTSLQTQLENCLTYCQDKGYYDVAYRFSEAYSGLTLDRPKLTELRELVRSGDIDVIVCYSLDRLSRDPTHGVILIQELEKYNVSLEAVTEDVENTELGKLISYIRGFASKLEAEKIRERTSRGRRAKAKLGHITGGGFARTYGYDYIKKNDNNSGRRVINETEAEHVRQMYQWLVNEGMSTTGITNRLNSMGVPAKRGGYWTKQTVSAILTNKSYAGKTYAFTMKRNNAKYSRPKEDWIEIPDVTPAIIDHETFEAAQNQLRINRNKTVNTTKHEYLLRGHIRCRQCGRPYTGGIHSKIVNGKRYAYTRYRCMGKVRQHSPFDRCHNKNWWCNKLEPMVWAELERYLSDRDLIKKVLNDQQNYAGQVSVYESELERVERQIKATDREQHQLLQWALKGFPESQVESENRRLNKAKETLNAQKVELEAQLKISQDAAINVPKLESFIRDMQDKLPNLDFEGKRLALDMLDITVWIDGETAEITGTVDPEWGVSQTMQIIR